ncbi:MAG: right-handed parallel beta-helix repeat-containing protein [Chitinispirillaceae bacterium]|nr:right-handed parallel beta-helix repeat-containing protein [Chitinispirillaceae bacterium]
MVRLFHRNLLMVMFVVSLGMMSVMDAKAKTIRVPQDLAQIQPALDSAKANDTVLVAAGRYAPAAIEQKDSITLIGQEMPRITRGAINQDLPALLVKKCKGWTIEGFETDSTMRGIALEQCTTMTVAGNYCHHHNEISSFHGVGIYVYRSRDIMLKRNIVVRNEYLGLNLSGSKITVLNNTVGLTTGYEAIAVDEALSDSIDIINNILFSNGANTIEYREAVQNGRISYNLFWQSGESPHCVHCTPDSTNSEADPLFVNAARNDFHLQAASPAVNKGDPGLLDPDSSRSDIGALWLLDSCAEYPVLIPVPSGLFERRPLLTWHPHEGMTTFTVQADTLPTFGAPLFTIPTADTFLLPLIDFPVATIYWRVKGGEGKYTRPSRFTIIDDRVPRLIPVEPPLIRDTRPELRWHPATGQSEYTIQIDTSSAFSGPIVALALADTSFTPLTGLPCNTIYWRVKGNSANIWSLPSSFTIAADTIPFMVRFNGDSVTTARPTLRWSAVVGASNYTVYYADNPAFDSPGIIPVSDTSFTPLSDLAQGVWYWKVSSSRAPLLFPVPDSFRISSVPVINNHALGLSAPESIRDIRIKGNAISFSLVTVRTNKVYQVAVADIAGRILAEQTVAVRSPHQQVRIVVAGLSRIRTGTYVIRVRGPQGAHFFRLASFPALDG